MGELSGRHALVGGSSQGIGRAIAFALAAQGAELSLFARDRRRLDALVPELIAAGAPAVRPVVADHDDLDAVIKSVSALVADRPVHILVHNTGGPRGGPLLDADPVELLRAFSRNVLVLQQLVKIALPGMSAAGYGRIVSVLSTSAREPIANLGAGNTARAAMMGFSKTLANELPPGVTINNVLPGYTRTDRLMELADANANKTGRTRDAVLAEWAAITPEKRIAEPDEIAALVAFLCSPRAGFVRGQSIAADGGRLKGL